MAFRSPEALLMELGITEPGEIDVEAVAYHCGAAVRYRRLDGCSARIIGSGDHGIISVDLAQSRGRQRFSIGHEIGHWMRDRGKAVYLCQSADLGSPWGESYRMSPESRANEYAAELLMPAFMFRPAARDRPMTFETVHELSEMFETSHTATAIRLVQLGSSPAMVVCYDMRGRRWYSAGVGVPSAFRPPKELPHDTAAFELLFGGVVSARPVMTDGTCWVDRRSSAQYRICEHAVKVAADVILVMLWWTDASHVAHVH